MLKNTVISMFSLITLAGCGGSSVSPSFASLKQEAANIDTIYRQQFDTDAENMPVGTFTYNSVLVFDYGAANFVGQDGSVLLTGQFTGDATLEADFTNSTVTGAITNFVDSANKHSSGTVDISNGKIVTNTFSADASGTITDSVKGPALLEGSMSGRFAGEAANSFNANFFGQLAGKPVSGELMGTR